ncbi:hypothetical protein ANCDUO_01789 [Ancylostoma duodenale]|uniref:Uncharacterized protein n=1 Tax=Ancylostoma duodenale TaxID=51022 RepID=A0A0C2H8I4_9BILA|nr:hypothetical protein ANCDUO_01789 [Ancylostoma duodenale]
MAYTTDITVPIYSVYIVLAAMLSAVVTVAAVFYKSRKPIDLDQLDCEQQAKLFSPQMLAPQLIFDTSPRPVQPHSLKQKLSPWKSARRLEEDPFEKCSNFILRACQLENDLEHNPPLSINSRTAKKNSCAFMGRSQHVIDSLKPESVSEYRGKLNFSIAFEKEVSTLHVHLLEAVDLPVKDITGE